MVEALTLGSEMRAAVIFVLAALPMPPNLCLQDDVMDSFLCPGSDSHYYFVERHDCDPPVPISVCEIPASTETFEPEPLHCDAAGADPDRCIEPGYDEHDPEGPQPGPPGAGTVDKPG